jgi:hypothetical protein
MSRFFVDDTEFVEISKYVGSNIRYYLTSDAGFCKRIKSATAAFGALKNIFSDKYLSEKPKDMCTWPWSCPIFSMAAKFGPQPLCPQYVSHQHRQHYLQQHSF